MQKRIYCKTSEIEQETFKNIIKGIKGIKEIIVIDEEDYDNDTLLYIIGYCKCNLINLSFITNGIRKNSKGEYEHISKSEINKIINLGFDKIILNLQETNMDMYDSLYNARAIEHSASTLIQASTMRIETQVNYIPLRTNYKDFHNIIDLFNSSLVKSINILQNRTNNGLTLTSEEYKEFRAMCKNERKIFRGSINMDHLDNVIIDKDYVKGKQQNSIKRYVICKF